MTSTEAREQDIPETCAADRQYTSEGVRVSYQIVATPEAVIAKNNRLALLVDIHQKRQAKGKPQKTEDVMATNKKKVVCDCCKRDKLNLSNCSGDVICSSCAAMYGAINNRLPILASAVERLGKADQLVGLLGRKVEVVEVAGDNSALLKAEQERDHYQTLAEGRLVLLNEIANIVGVTDGTTITPQHFEDYAQSVFSAGQNRINELEQLIGRIAEVVGCAAGAHEDLVEAVAYLDSDRRAMLNEGPPRDLTRSLGLPEDALWSITVLAAIQTSALLDHAEFEALVRAVETTSQPIEQDWLLRLRDLLGMPVSRQSELVDAVALKIEAWDFAATELDAIRQTLGVTDPRYSLVTAISEMAGTLDHFKTMSARYTAEKNILADQVSSLEQTATVNEQIFARFRELLDADGLANGELPSVLDSLLHEGLVNAGVRLNDRFSSNLGVGGSAGLLQIPGELQQLQFWPSPDPIKDALVDFALRSLSGQITLVHQEAA